MADAMIASLARDQSLTIGRNQPYAPEQGVFYTMTRHAGARATAMIEVRNDLLSDEAGEIALGRAPGASRKRGDVCACGERTQCDQVGKGRGRWRRKQAE